MVINPLYDINKSFFENYREGPFFNGTIAKRFLPPKELWHDFLGYKVASRIGVSACPIAVNSKGVKLCSQLGFDIITYKTIRNKAHQAHPWPNLAYVNHTKQLTLNDVHQKISYKKNPTDSMENLGITVSIGNACVDRGYILQDIERARSVIQEGQILIVSVFGTASEQRTLSDDFVYIAQQARDAGAHIIEANFSCPNIEKGKGIIYLEPDRVYDIARKMSQVLQDTPLLIKVGVFQTKEHMKKIFTAAARAGVRGITGINAVGMQVVNEYNQPFFGEKRIISGVCGAPIRNLALQFIKDTQDINHNEKLHLTILATGGITQAHHFNQFFDTGADSALSATGALWDPYLAIKYHEEYNQTIDLQETIQEKRF